MTEKRFEIIKSAIIDGARVIKDNENKYTFATTFETATLINYRKALNELHEENEQLKQSNEYLQGQLEDYSGVEVDNIELRDENEYLKKENKELRQDNDIKFWKHQFMIQHNRTQLILHELSLAMNEGYEVSDKFKQYMDEIKEHNKEIQEKHKRLFE